MDRVDDVARHLIKNAENYWKETLSRAGGSGMRSWFLEGFLGKREKWDW